MILGILLVLVMLFIFDFTGYIVTKKDRSLITVPFGAFIFFSMFQMFSLFFMVYHANFAIYRAILLVGIVIIYGILLFKHPQYFTILKDKFKNKYFLLVLVFGTIFAIILALVSLPYADSWLYGAMTFSSIDNNSIYSNNGNVVGGTIISFHYSDGYYLFLGTIVSLLKLDHLVGLMTICKAIEALLIIFTLGSLCEELFKDKKQFMFTIIGTFVLLGCFFFGQYPQDTELYGHSFTSVPMGINLFNSLGVYILFLYVIKYATELNRTWILPLLINGAFFMTSSSLFIVSAFLVIFTIYDVVYKKSTNNLYSIIIGFGVIASYLVIYILHQHILLMVVTLIIGWIICVVFAGFITKLQYKNIRTLVMGLSITYLVLTLLMFLLLKNSLEIVINILLLKHDKIYFKGSHYYFNVFANIPILVLFTLGIIYLYQRNKKIFFYIIIALIMFANPIAYRILGTIIKQEVYHRIFVLFMPSVVMMFGLYSIVLWVNKYIPIKRDIYIISVLAIIVVCYPNYQNIFTGFSNFTEYKYQSKDMYELTHFDYSKTKNVNFGGAGMIKLDSYNQADNIVRYRGDLSVVDCSDEQPFYIILRKEAKMDLPIEFSTPNYNVYYTDGGICLLNKE